MGASTLRLRIQHLTKLDSNHCNGDCFRVEDIGCNGQLTVLTGRWEYRFLQVLQQIVNSSSTVIARSPAAARVVRRSDQSTEHHACFKA